MEQGDVALAVMGIILVIYLIVNRVQHRRIDREMEQEAAQTR